MTRTDILSLVALLIAALVLLIQPGWRYRA